MEGAEQSRGHGPVPGRCRRCPGGSVSPGPCHSVSQVPVAEGKSVQQTVELLARRLEALGADKQGTFGVDCETYHTAAALGTQGQQGRGQRGQPFSKLLLFLPVLFLLFFSFSFPTLPGGVEEAPGSDAG